MLSVNIRETQTDLFLFYPGQSHPQDAFIALDIRDGRVWLDVNGEIGNAVPMDVWHGLVRRYTFSRPPKRHVASAILREAVPLLQAVLEGYEEVWDGSNHVARVIDGHDAVGEIEAKIEALCEIDEDDAIQWAYAADWLADVRRGIEQELRDGKTIADLVNEYDSDSDGEDEPILIDLIVFLERMQEGLN